MSTTRSSLDEVNLMADLVVLNYQTTEIAENDTRRPGATVAYALAICLAVLAAGLWLVLR
jgi:hypothetical protein